MTTLVLNRQDDYYKTKYKTYFDCSVSSGKVDINCCVKNGNYFEWCVAGDIPLNMAFILPKPTRYQEIVVLPVVVVKLRVHQ